jgi:two-component system sensor histidine kinase KdpD
VTRVADLDRLEAWLTSSDVRRRVSGVLASVLAVAVVTGAIYGFREWVPVLGLGVLYVFAVLAIAVLFGRAYAVPVAIGSMLAFNFFFLPPVHTFTLADGSNWFVLAVYLVTAIVASDLAARARRRAAEAEQREQEETLLAELSTALLLGAAVPSQLDRIAPAVALVLRVERARIELGPEHEPPAGESPYPLEAAGRRVGTLYVREGPRPNLAIRRRFLPALASLLAVATDRERLTREAVEAEALRRSDTVKTAVLRAVSHDLRSPLTAIRVAGGTLRRSFAELPPSDREALLDTVSLEAERLERIVANLLDLSRLQAGAAQPQREFCPLDELLARALTELGRRAARVDVRIGDQVPPVEVDAAQLERVLVNVLDNALKFSPEDERVAVRVTSTRKEVLVRVVDRGPGIPEGELEYVFEAFQLGSTGAERRGSGLGLAIARGFAEANGGRLWAESRPGQGATFVLALPAAPVPAAVGA